MLNHMIPTDTYSGGFIVNPKCALTTLNNDQMFIRESNRFYDSVLIMNTVGTGKTLAIVSMLCEYVDQTPSSLTDIKAIVVMKAAQIGDFMSNVNLYRRTKSIPAVAVCTYQKFDAVYRELVENGHNIGLVIVDEFHLYSYNIYATARSKNHQSIMTLINMPPTVRRVAVTATPMINTPSDIIVTTHFLTGKAVPNPLMAVRELVNPEHRVAIYNNIAERGYPTVHTVNVGIPIAYRDHGRNPFGRDKSSASLYSPCNLNLDIQRYDDITTGTDLITGGPVKLTPNGCMFEIMARTMRDTSPSFEYMLRMLGQTIDEPGITAIYFDRHLNLLVKFAAILDICGMRLLTKDSNSVGCNYLMMTGEASQKYKPAELYIENKSKYNVYGEKVKVVLYSSAFKEGVSFLNVLRVITVQTWNSTTECQSLGRSFRINSYTHMPEVPKYMVGGKLTPFVARLEIPNTYSDRMRESVAEKDAEILPIVDILKAASVKHIPTQSISHATAANSNHIVVETNYRHPIKLYQHLETYSSKKYLTQLDKLLGAMLEYLDLHAELTRINKIMKTAAEQRELYGMREVAVVSEHLIHAIHQQIYTIEAGDDTTIKYQITPMTIMVDAKANDGNIRTIEQLMENLETKITVMLRESLYQIVKFDIRDMCEKCGEQVSRVLDGRMHHLNCDIASHIPPRYAICASAYHCRAFHAIHSVYHFKNFEFRPNTITFDQLLKLCLGEPVEIECTEVIDITRKR